MILRMSLVSTLSQLFGRLANFILPLLFLVTFGGSQVSDTLFLAFSIVFFFGSTLANSASDAFTPSLSNDSVNRPDGNWLIFVTFLSAISFFLVFISPPEISRYSIAISFISLSLVFVGLLSSLHTSKLYFFGDFITPGVTWSFRWIAIIPILLFHDVKLAAVGFLLFVLIADTVRLTLLIRSAEIRERLKPLNKEKVLSSSLVIWFMCSSSLSGLNPLIDRFIAGYLGEGAVSQLELVERLASLFLLVPTIGILQVLNVEINKKIDSHSEWDHSAFLWQVFLGSVAWSLFCLLTLWLFNENLYFIFGREIWENVSIFSYGLTILISMAPALFIGMVGVRILLALSKGRLVFYLSGASLIVNAVTSFPLGIMLGVNGILLATVLTYSLTALALVLFCSKYCRESMNRL